MVVNDRALAMCGQSMQQSHSVQSMGTFDLTEALEEEHSSAEREGTMDQDRLLVRRSICKGSASTVKKRVYAQHDYQDHFWDPYYDPVLIGGSRYPGVIPCAPRGGVLEQFPWRLHKMLKEVEMSGFGGVVSWQAHGRAFKIHRPQVFADNIMPKHFKQSKLASFKRQVNIYGFQRLTKGPDKGAYYHPLFLRGRPDLCRRIARMKVKGKGGKPIACPDEEPDLYALPHCHHEREVATIPFVPTLFGSSMSCFGSTSATVPGFGVARALPSVAGAAASLLRPSLALSESSHTKRTEGQDEAKSVDAMAGATVSAIGQLNQSQTQESHEPKDEQQQRPNETLVDTDDSVLLRENIQEVNIDAALDMLLETQLPLSQSSVTVTPNSCSLESVESQAGRPLQAPGGMHKFNNFHPIPGTPRVEGSSHHKKANDSSDTVPVGLPLVLEQERSLLPFCPASTLSSSFCPAPLPARATSDSQLSSTSLPKVSPVSSYDNFGLAFQEAIKTIVPDSAYCHSNPLHDPFLNLVQPPAQSMGASGMLSEEDLDIVLELFRG